MKIAAKPFSLAVISAVVLLAGCTKKPLRPTPDQTMMGPGNAGPAATADSGVSPENVNINPDAPALAPRSDVLEDQFTIRGLLKPVYFAFDRSAIKSSERPKLEAAAQYLQSHPQQRLLLEGHCDWRGTAEYNMGLGERRAEAAKQWLTGHGVDASRLDTTSKGSLEAIKNGTEDQMAKDRRVEIIILKNPGSGAAAAAAASGAGPDASGGAAAPAPTDAGAQ